MTRFWRWVEIGKRLLSVGRSWTSTSPLGRYYWCSNVYRLLWPLISVLTIVFVLLLPMLHLLLLPHPFIIEKSFEHMVKQLVFFCNALTRMKMTLLTELDL